MGKKGNKYWRKGIRLICKNCLEEIKVKPEPHKGNLVIDCPLCGHRSSVPKNSMI